jgi:hypothetical protein
MPCTDAIPEAEPVEAVEELDVAASVTEEDIAELTGVLDASDPVVMGNPSLSVVGAGSVVMSAAATVTLVRTTPVLVYTQRHFGDWRGI